MKVTISGFIFANKYVLDSKVHFSFADYDRSQFDKEFVIVQPHVLEVDVPDDFDIRGRLVINLQAAKKAVRAEAEAKVTALDQQIQTLLAIENASTNGTPA